MPTGAVNCDVLVVGAGPAGLTAAVYLARYRRDVLVVHDGASRAARIPLTHNAPAFPGGISGDELLGRMQAQAELYGARVRLDHITALRHTGGAFAAEGEAGAYTARAVILATGVALNQVDLAHEIHEAAIGYGCLRYCPICDGYEAAGRAVGVLGSSAHGAREALFLREFTDKVTLLTRTACELTEDQRDELARAGVEVVVSPVREYRPAKGRMDVVLDDGRTLAFGVLYPALGATPRSELAAGLGVALSEGGCIPTDMRQRLGVEGLYAAGDVVEALDQITVAIGHGAVAATQAHNWLREQDGLVLGAG